MPVRKSRRPRKTPASSRSSVSPVGSRTSSTIDEMLLAALERGDDTFQTGRFLVTFKEGAAETGIKSLRAKQGLRTADARDFTGQSVVMEDVGDADALVFPEIGVALLGG